ncbi:hypothetical protein AOXY_G35312 [Acipenser oxyrinchus oxyrinchus]|uniref:Uncharacterized protein n=1 Tax=Acipenser oxyrinchus oxyrinchus TaxID=40147 RepID=A0AAD8CF75_ACIOX|nr:hypothetical protein AOXY_G36943 [Acipenser oxyrinchus oxyrinchus]KAK1148014.1 hypothetical protein AOXY_G35312 [Acipenser oxyrinchus oxyrinchus]
MGCTTSFDVKSQDPPTDPAASADEGQEQTIVDDLEQVEDTKSNKPQPDLQAENIENAAETKERVAE